MSNIGSLFASIGLETNAVQNDIKQVEQSFTRLGASAKKILDGVGDSNERLTRRTSAYASELKSLVADVERSQARLKLYQSDAGQALLKQREALQKDINKITSGGVQQEQGQQAKGLTTVMGGLGRSVLAVAGAYLTLQSAARVTRFIISEGTSAEKIWNDVASSLKLHGHEVERNTAQMKAFAAARQEATGIDDETTAQAQIRLLDANIDLADSYKLIAAAQDFAVAKDMDLVSAADLIGKSIDSDVNALGRYGIQLDKTLPKQEQINQLLDQLGTKFGGRAAAQMDTMAGKMALLSATTSDLAENLFTKLSPAFESSLDSMQSFLKGLVDATASTEDSVRGANEALSTFDKQVESLTPLIARYDELQKKASLNKTEHEELMNVIGKIRDIAPYAVSAWDKLGNAIGLNTEFLRKYNEEQRAALLIPQNKGQLQLLKEFLVVQRQIEKVQKSIPAVQSDDSFLGIPFAKISGSVEELKTRLADLVKQNRSLGLALGDTFKLMSDDGSMVILENVEAFNKWAQSMSLSADEAKQLLDALLALRAERIAQEKVSQPRNLPSFIPQTGIPFEPTDLVSPLTEKDSIAKIVQQYEQLLMSQKLTVAQLESLWGTYNALKLKWIDDEAQKLGNLGSVAQESYRQTARAALDADKIQREHSIIQAQIDGYNKLLESGTLSARTLEKVWSELSEVEMGLRRESIEGWLKEGQTVADVAGAIKKWTDEDAVKYIYLSTAVLRKEFEEIQKLIDSPTTSKAQLEALLPKIEKFDAEPESKLRGGINAGLDNFRDAQIAGLEILLQSNKLTASELSSVWDDYYSLQQERLKDLQIGWEKSGFSQVRMGELTDEFNAKLEDQQKELAKWLKSYERWFGLLEDDARKLAEAMSQSFENNFFRAMEGEFVHFSDFVKAIVSDITRSLEQEIAKWASQQLTRGIINLTGLGPEEKEPTIDNSAKITALATEAAVVEVLKSSYTSLATTESSLTQFIGLTGAQSAANAIETGSVVALTASYVALAAAKAAASIGGSDGGSPMGDFNISPDVFAASGGLFTSPTLAMIGEAGPEAVVPLGRMNDQTFWDGIGVNRPNGGDSVVVNMTVVAQDMPSFKASQSQIMAEMQTRAGQAFRRNR